MAYITLDNVDGKQARRTGTSSPLGQMFDHGCDAITFNLAVITTCRYQQNGSNWLNYAFIACGPTGYFMYNLKEYYMGEYYLPFINPVSEGSLLSFCVLFFCYYFGWQACQSEYAYGMSVPQLYCLFIVITQIYQNIEMLFEIIRAGDYEIELKPMSFVVNFASYFLVFGL